MKQTILFILLTIGFVSQQTIAQEVFDQGTFTYEISDVSAENPQMAQQLEMMKGSKMDVYFKGDKQITNMNMMNGMMQQKYVSDIGGEGLIMYMDMMGQKIKVDMSEDDIEKMKNQSNVEFDVTYDKDDMKKILDYNAYKALITIKSPEGEDMILTAYVTDEIKTKATIMRDIPGSDKIDAFPLEFSNSNSGVKMTFTATNISGEVDESKFEFDTSGYQEMSIEDLQNMGGGF